MPRFLTPNQSAPLPCFAFKMAIEDTERLKAIASSKGVKYTTFAREIVLRAIDQFEIESGNFS